jgi:hypothetical protein
LWAQKSKAVTASVSIARTVVGKWRFEESRVKTQKNPKDFSPSIRAVKAAAFNANGR